MALNKIRHLRHAQHFISRVYFPFIGIDWLYHGSESLDIDNRAVVPVYIHRSVHNRHNVQ